MNLHTVADFFLAFAYYYPLFMSYLWMCGGIYYRFHWEDEGDRAYSDPPPLTSYPKISVLIPCFNEEIHIEDTIHYINEMNWPEFEIIAINDGSGDKTAEVLDRLAAIIPRLRVVHLLENRGKANALRAGALLSTTEYLVCIDSDALLDKHAVPWLMRHVMSSPRVAAVTGNPRIRNRSSLLGKIQVGEFSSIIGLIKRSQRIYGRIFTVSGVVTLFRKAALHRVGYWSNDILTDDIDVSWRLQLDHWDVRYEPNALCWILMPETYTGLWRQRLRWAMGGAETALRYFGSLCHWNSRRMWGVFIEYTLSVIWSYVLLVIILLWAIGKFIALPEALSVPSLVPGWHGMVLASTCLLQFLVSLVVDSRYEKGQYKYLFWMIWYPLAYWMLNVFTVVFAVPKVIFRRAARTGRWTSPDRGLQDESNRT